MDSFILFNDDTGPTNDDKSTTPEQDLHVNGKSDFQDTQNMQANDKTVL